MGEPAPPGVVAPRPIAITSAPTESMFAVGQTEYAAGIEAASPPPEAGLTNTRARSFAMYS